MRYLELFALGPLLAGQSTRPAPTPVECCVVGTEVSLPLTGSWTLSWDDSTDLTLDEPLKSCRIALTCAQHTLVGSFVGPVLGRERKAVFTGEELPGGPRPLIALVQREEDYSCAYLLTRQGPTHLTGTWRDSRGAGGTVELMREPSPADGADLIVTSTGER
jgi:hypothetical protein